MSFYVVLTDIGQAKLANAVALGTQIKITHLAVGDANGTQPNPAPSVNGLIHERHRAAVNRIDIDAKNPNWVVLEQVLPPDVGGWEIREIGAFDADGNLIAYGNYPPTYKPLLNEGTSRTQTIRMVMQVSDAAAVTLKVDPSVVLATRQYVDDKNKQQIASLEHSLSEHINSRNHPDADTVYKGFVRLATIEEAQLGKNNSAVMTPEASKAAIDALTRTHLSHVLDEIVGIPLPWPKETPPTGWLACNGQQFDKNMYPKLADAYPSGILPDLRGEFIRGWDGKRGIDEARSILSWQDSNNKAHNHETWNFIGSMRDSIGSYTFGTTQKNQSSYPNACGFEHKKNDAKIALTNTAGGNESRPRNIAYNYIIKAA